MLVNEHGQPNGIQCSPRTKQVALSAGSRASATGSPLTAVYLMHTSFGT